LSAAAPARRGPLTAHLLSIYDEYLSSYRDRSAICDPADGKKLVGMGAALGSVFIVGGRIAGTWRRTIDKRTVRIELTPFRKLRKDDKRAVAAAAERFTRFMGEHHTLELRFA
jgi:hypothetical protein